MLLQKFFDNTQRIRLATNSPCILPQDLPINGVFRSILEFLFTSKRFDTWSGFKKVGVWVFLSLYSLILNKHTIVGVRENGNVTGI